MPQEKSTLQELEELKEFDVRKILIDVVPGWEGNGVEVYAKNIDDIYQKFNELWDRIESLENQLMNEVTKNDGGLVEAMDLEVDTRSIRNSRTN